MHYVAVIAYIDNYGGIVHHSSLRLNSFGAATNWWLEQSIHLTVLQAFIYTLEGFTLVNTHVCNMEV